MSDDENIEIEGNFTPIVNLPLVENILEDSEIVFEREVIAYLYDTKVIPNEWKERGVGKLRILKENDHGRYRILMRRNQVKKVCLNHLVHSHFKVVKHQSKGTTLIWFTSQDWSDGEPEKRSFAAKFTTKEDSEQFLNEVNKIVKELNELPKDIESEESETNKDKQNKSLDSVKTPDGDSKEICEKVENLNIK